MSDPKPLAAPLVQTIDECVHCFGPKRIHSGRKKYCGSGETRYKNNTNVRVVRHVDRPVLGSEGSNLVPLPITDDRNENPDYAAWEGI